VPKGDYARFRDEHSYTFTNAISGHPRVGALRNLEQLQAPRNASMVHIVVQLQELAG